MTEIRPGQFATPYSPGSPNPVSQPAPVVQAENSAEIKSPPAETLSQPAQEEWVSPIHSLKELIDRVSARSFKLSEMGEESGLAEVLPFPFLAMVGQKEMKLALLLGLVNPAIGGILLIGPRGTGKTTAVRSLSDLLPMTPRSLCHYGCLPEDIETGGIDAVCPDCARKYGSGEPLAKLDRVRLIELPLNARIEDVVGGLDERVAVQERLLIKRGILAQAHRNLLYIDEVNLLPDEVVDSILDAASYGSFTVRRGPLSATYRARFMLIGSMNPEEGRLRPQMMDRFGLRVLVRGLSGPQAAEQRLEVYRRVQAYQANSRQVSLQYEAETLQAQAEIQAARETLPRVILPDTVAQQGLKWVEKLQINSLRTEITLFEAARAYAAMDGRLEATAGDLAEVAPLALRMRRSQFITEFFAHQDKEEQELQNLFAQ